MKRFLRNLWLRNDQARARDALQDICDERVAAKRRFEQLNRDADRALREAQALEQEQFRASFFGNRNVVRSAFLRVAK